MLTVNTGDSANARSLMLMIEYGEFTAILAGDAEGITESQAVTNFSNNLKANVLSASHHGSNSHQSNGGSWITATAPDVVVFSAGVEFGHPRCPTVNRFTAVVNTLDHTVRCGVSATQYGPVTRTRRAHYVTEIRSVTLSNGLTGTELRDGLRRRRQGPRQRERVNRGRTSPDTGWSR